ncbi:hypothetical protein E1H13_07385 [Nodosilinea sp. P-1105]|nr:hypothetical protein [Nodosilinea sp. P-1105]
MTAPSNPKIYHITHLDNLTGIATTGSLVSDAKRIASGLSCSLVRTAVTSASHQPTVSVKPSWYY